MRPDLSALTGFSDQSRVWLYQSNRRLTDDEIRDIDNDLSLFVQDWKAHGKGLKATALVLNPFFIVFIVDESTTLASGCSIDSSVAQVKKLQQKYSLDFFDRMRITVWKNDDFRSYHFQSYFDGEALTSDYIFDPLIDSLAQLRRWPIPVNQSSFAHLLEGVF